MSNTESSPLAGLMRLEEYQQQRQQFFPGLESVRWFMRANRAGLVESGGLAYIAGRLWVRADRFDAFVMQTGEKAAAEREAAKRGAEGQGA